MPRVLVAGLVGGGGLVWAYRSWRGVGVGVGVGVGDRSVTSSIPVSNPRLCPETEDLSVQTAHGTLGVELRSGGLVSREKPSASDRFGQSSELHRVGKSY